MAQTNNYRVQPITGQKGPSYAETMANKTGKPAKPLHPLALLIAKNFKSMREQSGTQEEVGSRMGLSQPQVGQLENGSSLKRVSNLGHMLESAGFDPFDVVKLDREPLPPELVELSQLWARLSPTIKGAIMGIAREQAAKTDNGRVIGSE